MLSYDAFVTEWNGRQVTRFGGLSTALIAEYEAENNLPVIYGDTVEWINNPVMSVAYEWVANDTGDADQLPDKGDIVVWEADLPGMNGTGHMAFYDHSIDNYMFENFAQNYGGTAAHFQVNDWHHVAGWYTKRPPSKAIAVQSAYSPPSAPVLAPSLTDKYLVVKPISSYPASSSALTRTNSIGTVQPGSYYVQRRFNGMLNLTLIPGQPSWWVNPDDNIIIHPVAADISMPNKWKSTYQPFKDINGNVVTRSYQVTATIDVQDLASQRKDKRIYANESYDFAGTFTGPDGYEYYRPEGAASAHLWFGADPQYLTLIEEPGTTEAYIETEAYHTVRPLSATEQVWVGISKAASYYPKVMELIKQRRSK